MSCKESCKTSYLVWPYVSFTSGWNWLLAVRLGLCHLVPCLLQVMARLRPLRRNKAEEACHSGPNTPSELAPIPYLRRRSGLVHLSIRATAPSALNTQFSTLSQGQKLMLVMFKSVREQTTFRNSVRRTSTAPANIGFTAFCIGLEPFGNSPRRIRTPLGCLGRR